MINKKNAWLLFTLIIVQSTFIYAQDANLIYGSVFDDYGLPVTNATLTFTNEDDTIITHVCTTSVDGNYQFSLAVSSVKEELTTIPNDFALMQNYPNPFNPATIIPFVIERSSHVNLSVYNILGQHIKTLISDTYPPGQHFIQWDGTNNRDYGVSAGVYIYRIVVDRRMQAKKMLLIDGGANTSLFFKVPEINDEFTRLHKTNQTAYTVNITGDNIKPYERNGIILTPDQSLDFDVEQIVRVPFAAQYDYLGIYNGAGYDQLFIKGVNLGVSVPGTHPGELAATREQYDRWLEKMGEIGLNTLRIYTLHFPRFYQALYDYNSSHPDNPLYLFQGIWLNEENPSYDLEQLSIEFDSDIEEVIDCVHGNRTIDNRFGKAYGEFNTDISEWIIGYIIGREIFPEEVLNTNSIYPDSTDYLGTAIQIDSVTATEVWAAKHLNKTIVYERNTYDVERPVSISSWPTLDPLTHPTEDSTRSNEDKAILDLGNIQIVNAPAGVFIAYHAYPYYPDFISEDPGYIQYSDSEGPNSYLGYLNDIKDHYSGMPLIIAEFGVPSSWGNAHYAQSGMHQGGFDEKQQGEYNVRMLQNIYEAGCGGGMLFSWIDEWFKQSWITNPIGPDASRRPLWHNVTNPEQNYGLIAFDPDSVDFSAFNAIEDSNSISRVQVDVDNQFFYLKITLDSALSISDSLIIGFDTYRSDLGESILPDGSNVTNRAEFTLVISENDTAQLYVTESYDLFGIFHDISVPEQLFHSIATDGAPWVPVRWKNNYYEEAVYNVGALSKRDISDDASSLDAVTVEDTVITVKIPWTLLQFTDPSLLEVMNDDRSTSERETVISDGIALSVVHGDDLVETDRFLWDSWNTAPATAEREKVSLQIFSDGLSLLPHFITYPISSKISDKDK
ncbi:T9SS type A sorting domain-containing protein [candidate division KSB1 bacterium]